MKTSSKLLKKIFLPIAFLLMCESGLAQSTVGTDFWLTFLPNYDGDANELSLIVAAQRPCMGTITNSNTNWGKQFYASAGTTTVVTIPKTQASNNNSSDNIINAGLHVTSTDSISLYASNFAEYTFDVTDVLPTQSLGSDYVIQTYSSAFKGRVSSNYDKEGIEHDRSEFSIVATEDNTLVTILLSDNSLNGHYAYQPFNVTLNTGQCYQVLSAEGADLSGTRITASDNKKIAVFAGNLCTLVPTNCKACDHIVEQMMPVTCWGQNFVITSSMLRTSDVIRITALNDNCKIKKNGAYLTTIDALQTYELEMFSSTSASMYIETSEPAMTYLYFVGAECAGDDGDPSMVIISPIEQRIAQVTFSTFNSGASQYHYVNIVTDAENVAGMQLDNSNIASQFSTVSGNSDYSYARIQVEHGSHTLTNTNGGFVAHVYGLGHCESYAYSVGAMAKNLTSNLVINGQNITDFMDGYTLCDEGEISFLLNLNYNPSQVIWDLGDGTIATGTQVSHYYQNVGNYMVTCDIYKIEDGQEVLVSTLKTFIHILYTPDLYIHGLTEIAVSSDLWPGIYNYCLADSTDLHQCNVSWSCSNPNWMILPSGNPYWCTLIAPTPGTATLTAAATCELGCDATNSIEISACYLDVEETSENPVLMYPNPANNQLIIRGVQLKQIMIYDCYGQKLDEINTDSEDEITVDTGNLGNGLYIADIVTTKGKTTKRFIISK